MPPSPIPAKKPTKTVMAPPKTPIDTSVNSGYGADPSRPGFGIGIDRGGAGVGYSMSQYDSWLSNMANSPQFVAMRNKYGDKYVTFEWNAMRTNMDGVTYQNALMMEFPDYTSIKLPGAGGSGRSGGGGAAGPQPPTPEQIASAEAAIKNRAAILGRTPFNEEELTWIATTVVKDGWSPAQLDDFLTTGDQLKSITQPGDISASVAQIKGMATSQLTNVSDATAREWATRIASGEMDIGTVGTIFQQQAQQEFGWAASSLQGGLTMRDILMPARDRIATELEKPAETVDLMDPRFRTMAQTTDANGVTKAATLTEVTQKARQDADWQHTAGAARLAADVAQQLRTTFEG